MQPDLLSAQREEEQPNSLSPHDLIPSESLSTPNVVQLEPAPAAEAVDVEPTVPVEKKRSRLNIAAIGLAFLVFLLLLSFAWVGYWTYILSTELAAAQQQLAALQSEHAKLQTEYTALTSEKEKLSADLTQSKADLEKANTDLTSARADLSESKQRGEKLDSKIETAGTLAEILYITATSDEESDILKIDRLINESNNQELMEQWDMLTQSPSENAFGAFLDYIVSAIRNSLR